MNESLSEDSTSVERAVEQTEGASLVFAASAIAEFERRHTDSDGSGGRASTPIA